MASAFSVFPNNGVRYETSSYTKVLDRHGNILLENNPEPQQVLDPGVAWIMTDILREVVTRGTGTNADLEDCFVGGKTGTTQDSYDIWFDGFTNNYSASVWIGCDISSELGSMSSTTAALWGKIMGQLDGTYLGERAEMPEDVIVYQGEYFVSGTEKDVKTVKDYEKRVTLCKESHLLATPECKETEEKKYYTYDDNAKKDIPKEYCYLHNTDPDTYPTTEEGKKYIEEEKKKEEEANKAAADPVIALITALPESPAPSDEAAIVAARAAYNSLTDKQKAAVGNDLVAKLSDAETKLEAAKTAAAEEEARKKAEEEARKQAEEEARKKAEEEAAKKAAEEEARKKAEEEAAKKAAEEEAARKAAEEEAARKAAEEEAARKAAEEEAARKAAEEEAARKAAEEEAARQAAEEEAARQAEEEASGEDGGDAGGNE